jgi:hypothetical protein
VLQEYDAWALQCRNHINMRQSMGCQCNLDTTSYYVNTDSTVPTTRS